MAKETRTRAWTVVVYPESAPENWRDYLDDMHLEWVESPLHEFDVNASGEVKKPHWHVLMMFGSVKSYDQVVEVCEPLNCPVPQRVHNSRVMVRYMAHLDNPDKFQYPVSEIIGHGGIDLTDLLKPCASMRYTLIAEMCDFVAVTGIEYFDELMDYARKERYDDWFPVLCDSSAYIVNQYIKAFRARCREARDYD